jgi:hypothetical protein
MQYKCLTVESISQSQQPRLMTANALVWHACRHVPRANTYGPPAFIARLVAKFFFPPSAHGGMLSAMNATLLLLLLVPADVPHVSFAVAEPVYDLAVLSHNDAQRVDGHRVIIRVVLESEPGETDDGMIVYACASPNAVNRTCWLVPR